MRNPKTKAMQPYITSRDAAAFHDKFVTLRTLSKAKGAPWQSLAARLKRAQITPFSPDGTDYGQIYLKAQVEALDL